MIAPSVPKKNKDQETLNSLLWRIVMNHEGHSITLRYEELKTVPKGAAINVDNIPGTDKVRVIAVVNGPIAVQAGRIIT